MELTITSKTHGTHTILLDFEDYELLKNRTIYLYTTKRHHTIYPRIQLEDGKSMVLHRYITLPDCKNKIVDHKNGNGLDNRRDNLRITDYITNNCNARKRKNALTSKYKGVSFCSTHKKWKAQIQYNKKKYSGGTHKTEIEAALAYNKLAEKYHKEAAVLNLVEVK